MGEFWEMPKYNGEVILGTGEQIPESNSWRNAVIKLQDILKKYNYQSWIITDMDEEITINKKLDDLIFEGTPYHYFWIADFDEYEKNYNRLVEKAREAEKRGDISTYNFYVEKANNLEPEVIPVSFLTKYIREQAHIVRELNPVVYQAMENTMKYAAFFRYIKEQQPQTWNKLLNETRYISITPKVKHQLPGIIKVYGVRRFYELFLR